MARGKSAAGATPTPDSRTRILQGALQVFREKGYTATTVDDLCRNAGITKGSFFHHFSSKEDAALATIEYWNTMTGELFANAPYWQEQDPRAQLLAYLDFRAHLIQGPLAEFTCLLGTLVQDTFISHPALRDAAGAGIKLHAQTLIPIVEAARARYAPTSAMDAQQLALHTQAVLQGGFVIAKALNDPQPVMDAVAHLKQYVEQLFPTPARRRR